MDETQQVPNQNPITPAPPIATYPMPQSVPTVKVPLIFISFIVILLGIASYFGYQNYQLKQQITIQQPTPTPKSTIVNSPTSTSTPVPTSDPTASWELYTNNENGYSIKFPQTDFTRLGCIGEELTAEKYISGNRTSPKTMISCERDSRYDLETKTYTTVQAEPEETKYYDIVKKDVQIGGVIGKLYVYSFTHIEDGPYPEWYAVAKVNKNNKTYEIYFGDKNKLDLFKQIIATFKFTK